MTVRKGGERSTYPKWKHSFDYFWRQQGKLSSYFKPIDDGMSSLGFDAQFIFKGKYYAIEYKFCKNLNKFTFSSLTDLESEVKKIQHIIDCGMKGCVIVIFEKFTKLYTIPFVVENWDKQILIEEGGIIIPEIKDELNRKIYDVSIIINKII